jgi:hypothetical protein
MAASKRNWNTLLTLGGVVIAAYVAFGAFMISLGGGWWAVALVPLVAIAMWLNQIYQPMGKRLAPRRFRALLIVLAVLQILSFVVPLVIVPKWLPAIALDGTDPQRTGCAEIGATVGTAQWPVVDTDTGAQLATALLRYSTTCDTTWVKLEGVAVGTQTSTQVRRDSGDWIAPAAPPPEVDSPSEGIAYSMQIRSNGCTYVNVSLQIGDNVVAELQEQAGCDQ